MKLYMVLAGNFREYQYWAHEVAHERGLKIEKHVGTGVYRGKDFEIRYLTDMRSLRGLRDWELIKVGNWFERKDANEIEDWYRLSQMR